MKKLTLPTSKKRNAVTLALVLLVTAVLLAVNILLPYLMHRTSFYPDLTTEGLYTMSDALVEELAYLEEDVDIIFCADPDYLFASEETRLPYVTCKKLAEENEHIRIKYIDVSNDPAAATPYKTTEGSKISWKDVIVSAGSRYKILSPSSFYGSEDNVYVTYNGEYRIATAILSLTAYKNGPCAYFTVGHGEQVYDPTLTVPFILRWKGHLPEGLRINDTAQLKDVLPTILDVIGIDKGVSLLMIENYRSGLIWDLFMNCDYIKTAIGVLGFQPDETPAEPYLGLPE